MKMREEKEGQEDVTKERGDAPDPPPYDPAAFIRHIRTLTTKERDEMLTGIGEDF